MKKIAVYILCLSIFTTLNCFAQVKKAKLPEESLDKIVAIVNDDVITSSEYEQAFSITKLQMSQAQMQIPNESDMKKQVMEQLINKKLQLQIAKQAGVQVSDEELNKAIEQVAESNNVSVSELLTHVNQGGMTTDDYRNEVRDQLTLQKLQQQEFSGKIQPVTAQEVANFMRSKQWQTMSVNSQEKEYHLEDILVPISDAPSADEITEAKQRAEGILQKLQQGQDIQTIKQAEMGVTKPIEGGDLGWHKLGDMPSAFTETVAQMQEKEVAGPLQTSNGFHLIHLVELRAVTGKTSPNREQAEQFLLQRKIDEALKIWMSKMRSQAYISTNPERA